MAVLTYQHSSLIPQVTGSLVTAPCPLVPFYSKPGQEDTTSKRYSQLTKDKKSYVNTQVVSLLNRAVLTRSFQGSSQGPRQVPVPLVAADSGSSPLHMAPLFPSLTSTPVLEHSKVTFKLTDGTQVSTLGLLLGRSRPRQVSSKSSFCI